MPQCISSGDSATGIGEILDQTGALKVFLVTDEGVRRAGLTEKIQSAILKKNAELTINDAIAPEPTYEQAQSVVDSAAGADLIIAAGGGSVMDAAKLASILAGSDIKVKDLLKDPTKAHKRVRSVMIPTTCGTGSEATGNAIVAVPEEKVKVGIVNSQMIPDYVFLDCEMIRNLPPKILAATGVDALAHAVECFTSKKANALSDAYALYAAKLIFDNIERAYANPGDMEAKKAMLIGAFFAGCAITASGTTAVHALSYPLGGAFHIPHGVSNAILFAPVMDFNADAITDRLEKLCDATAPAKYASSPEEKATYIIGRIAQIVKNVDIPTTLTAYGVETKDIDFLTSSAFGVRRLLDNNVKQLTPEDIRRIYLRVM
ncbi:MAG: iron-containing alcohol dehydrogenase [Clostridia bacterium]|nr:iron-containing alcohol dehydrogenase [Clostridia bacterium]